MNDTRSQYEELSQKLHDFEHEYKSDKKVVRGAAAVAVILLSAFFGISLRQIPAEVKKQMELLGAKEVETAKGEALASRDRIVEIEDQVSGLVKGFEQVAEAGDQEAEATCPTGTKVAFGLKWHWVDQTRSSQDGAADKSIFGLCEPGKESCSINSRNFDGDDEVRVWIVCRSSV